MGLALKGLNNKPDRLQERCIRITYSDKTSICNELLENGGSVSTHHQNIRQLAKEMFSCFDRFKVLKLLDSFNLKKKYFKK